MKPLLLMLLVALAPSLAGQTVFTVDYASQADVKVFVVEYESQADLKVFKVPYASQAKGNEGKWFWVPYASQAHKKVFFVDYASQADLKIFFREVRIPGGVAKLRQKTPSVLMERQFPIGRFAIPAFGRGHGSVH